jgi:hypothetical protein
MPIAELCALDVKARAADDAVLFLWVTSPMLEVSFQVIKAWGFQYKTSFVWDKVKHNFGHYNSLRHEFLLICTRGSAPVRRARAHEGPERRRVRGRRVGWTRFYGSEACPPSQKRPAVKYRVHRHYVVVDLNNAAFRVKIGSSDEPEASSTKDPPIGRE